MDVPPAFPHCRNRDAHSRLTGKHERRRLGHRGIATHDVRIAADINNGIAVRRRDHDLVGIDHVVDRVHPVGELGASLIRPKEIPNFAA